MGIFDGSSKKIKPQIRQGLINKCCELLLEGYEAMVKAQEYELSWDEEKLTANLISHMQKSEIITRFQIDITAESRDYDEEITIGTKSAKKAGKLDIRISIWGGGWFSSKKKMIYVIEAKNLSQSDWKKKTGAHVNARYQKKRYINKGIDHFISGHYKNGCLSGYVVQGDSNQIVKDINTILKNSNPSRADEVLVTNGDIDQCYFSTHDRQNKMELELKHFMLKLN